MKFLSALMLALILAGSQAQAAPAKIAPFTSDGCSDFPEGLPGDPNQWRECCFTHDIAYWMGGLEYERAMADQALENCVDRKANPFIGFTMYVGVRVGGSAMYPTSFRWGYGCSDGREYQSLTIPELTNAVAELRRMKASAADRALINAYLKEHDLYRFKQNLFK